jgi:hypothetical protein
LEKKKSHLPGVVVGFDAVELTAEEGDCNSAFSAARLVYRMLGSNCPPRWPGAVRPGPGNLVDRCFNNVIS